MKQADTRMLVNGIYRIRWVDDPSGVPSLAAVGSMSNGRKWLAPVNWSDCGHDQAYIWRAVHSVELVMADYPRGAAAAKAEGGAA